MSVTHSDLVGAASKWLQKKCACVITEIATTGEEPDAIGWRGSHSILVECKASRADFLADRQKGFRRSPQLGIGARRYFMAPKGLIAVEELPSMWGLLEYDAPKVRCARESDYFSDCNTRHEITILLSAMRRIGRTAPTGVSIRFYTIDTKNRATLGLDLGVAE